MQRPIVLPDNFAEDFRRVLSQDLGEYTDEFPVATYRRCFVTHTGLAMSGLRLLPETLFPVSWTATPHLVRYAWYKRATSWRVTLRNDGLLLLHNHWASGYYHWLVEVLTKVRQIEPAKHSVILPLGYPAFAQQSVELFPWREIVRVPAGRCVRARDLTIVGNPTRQAQRPSDIAWLRETLRSRCDASASATERVYLSRQHVSARRVLNEPAVIETLSHYGFQVVDTAIMSFDEQVRLFANCSMLVGAHGAGLSNIALMSPGTAVLELYRELTDTDPWMNVDYWNLASAAGVRYHYQFCRATSRTGPRADDLDLTVDTAKLRRNVELMLASRSAQHCE